MTEIITRQVETRLGTMQLAANNTGIFLFDYVHRKMMPAIQQRILKHHDAVFVPGDHHYFKLLTDQLEAYFTGHLQQFDLPIIMSGTDFQRSVWDSLLAIPYGSVRSYNQQAALLGNEKAIRAMASANGANCLAIIIPCHRVIGQDGSLTGYAGGLSKKKWLLDHERKVAKKEEQLGLFA